MRIKYYSGHQVVDVITEFANDKDKLLNMLNRFGALETDDVEPVRHGEWLKTDAYPHRVYCSKCYATYIPNSDWLLWTENRLPKNYCPNCGAHMDKGEADTNEID